MPRLPSRISGILLGLMVVTLISGSAIAQTEVEVTAEWNPPSFGVPVNYVIQHSVNNGDWVTIANPVETFHTFLVTVEDTHRIRIAGVDAEGLVGPFSTPSTPYPEPPGEPGQPELF